MELQTLKEKFFTELMKWVTDSHTNLKSNFDILVEGTEDGCDFWAKGFVGSGYDNNGNFEIWDLSIGEFGIQFPDFTGSLDKRFIEEIETFCKE
jgi:hypothetical protein